MSVLWSEPLNGNFVFATAAILACVATLSRAEDLTDVTLINEDTGASAGFEGEDMAMDDTYVDPGIWVEDELVVDGGAWIDGGEAIDGGNWNGDSEMVADMPTFDSGMPVDDDCGVTCEMAATGGLNTGAEIVTASARAPSRQRHETDWEELHKAGQRNICFEADLYIAILCDWQRPFLGDRMP